MPAVRFSSACISRCACISSWRSRSNRLRRRRISRRRQNSGSPSIDSPPSRRLDHPGDGAGHAVELRDLGGQLLTSGRREPVEASAPVSVCLAPLACHPAFDQNPLQSGIEGALLDLEDVLRPCLDVFGDPVAVQRAAPGQGLQDEHLESSGRDLCLRFIRRLRHRLSMYRWHNEACQAGFLLQLWPESWTKAADEGQDRSLAPNWSDYF